MNKIVLGFIIIGGLFWLLNQPDKTLKIIAHGSFDEISEQMKSTETKTNFCRMVKGKMKNQKCELSPVCYKLEKVKDKLGYFKGFLLREVDCE